MILYTGDQVAVHGIFLDLSVYYPIILDYWITVLLHWCMIHGQGIALDDSTLILGSSSCMLLNLTGFFE